MLSQKFKESLPEPWEGFHEKAGRRARMILAEAKRLVDEHEARHERVRQARAAVRAQEGALRALEGAVREAEGLYAKALPRGDEEALTAFSRRIHELESEEIPAQEARVEEAREALASVTFDNETVEDALSKDLEILLEMVPAEGPLGDPRMREAVGAVIQPIRANARRRVYERAVTSYRR